MKRELKGSESMQIEALKALIARLIPMKRELKAIAMKSSPSQSGIYRKAHPDEKGTESFSGSRYCLLCQIARLIPMKRELKEDSLPEIELLHPDRKAHPDEKGTESFGFYRRTRGYIIESQGSSR